MHRAENPSLISFGPESHSHRLSYHEMGTSSWGAGTDGTLSAALTNLMNLTTLTNLLILTNLMILKILVDLQLLITDGINIIFCALQRALIEGHSSAGFAVPSISAPSDAFSKISAFISQLRPLSGAEEV